MDHPRWVMQRGCVPPASCRGTPSVGRTAHVARCPGTFRAHEGAAAPKSRSCRPGAQGCAPHGRHQTGLQGLPRLQTASRLSRTLQKPPEPRDHGAPQQSSWQRGADLLPFPLLPWPQAELVAFRLAPLGDLSPTPKGGTSKPRRRLSDGRWGQTHQLAWEGGAGNAPT